MLGTFPKDFSRGYFPWVFSQWQLFKCASSQAATSQVCHNTAWIPACSSRGDRSPSPL